jgi:hypothetical protein
VSPLALHGACYITRTCPVGTLAPGCSLRAVPRPLSHSVSRKSLHPFSCSLTHADVSAHSEARTSEAHAAGSVGRGFKPHAETRSEVRVLIGGEALDVRLEARVAQQCEVGGELRRRETSRGALALLRRCPAPVCEQSSAP